MTTQTTVTATPEWRVVALSDLPESLRATAFYEDAWYAVVRYENDQPVAIVGTDHSQPEDASLMRDYNWVHTAIAAAYAEGQRAQNPKLCALAERLVAMDETDGPGAVDRRTVTLTNIIEQAREALGDA